jgi:GTP-binding protein
MTTPTPSEPTGRPIVAIVGRPNVGKSALFNRILGRRLAIVHEECGVTRDRVMAHAEWDNRAFDVMDTGGITGFGRSTEADVIDAEVRLQARAAINEAAFVILVVDATAGPSELDEEVARLLHRGGMRVVIAANKCDEPAGDDLAFVFQPLGFPVFAVSAMHNRGVDDLMIHVASHLPEGAPPPATIRTNVTIVGRPNVGKSSFINRLIRSPRLIVSDIPGTTRDSVDIPFSLGSGPTARHYMLTDTAGMRRLAKVDNTVERFSVMRTERSIQRADVVVLMLDAALGPSAQDKTIVDMILRERKGCVIIVNKWDLMGHSTQKLYQEALARALPFLNWVPVVFVSAQSGLNIKRCLDAIDAVAAHVQMPLTTGQLNRAVLDAYDRVQPPIVKGKRFKIYYATQTGVKPIRIGLFVNDPERLPAAYEEYLIKTLRRHFGLEGAPILLEPKARTRPVNREHRHVDSKPSSTTRSKRHGAGPGRRH